MNLSLQKTQIKVILYN